MNLNITPIDKISNELAAIDSYLNITMSEEVQEAVLRGNDLAVYIARTGKLLADAKYHLNGKKKSEVFDTLRETASRAGDRKSTRLNSSHASKSRMPSSA